MLAKTESWLLRPLMQKAITVLVVPPTGMHYDCETFKPVCVCVCACQTCQVSLMNFSIYFIWDLTHFVLCNQCTIIHILHCPYGD